jgi:TolB protein
VRQITTGIADNEIEDLSPDGRELVHISEAGGDIDLYVVPVAGGDPRPLVTGPTDEVRARWSPDGSRIAFGANRGSGINVYVIPTGGGTETRLTSMPSGGWEWSPQGDRIAFQAPGPDGTDDLWMIPASGGEATRLTDMRQVAELAWSPDGSSVLVSAGPPGFREIYRIPADGGPAVPLGTGAGEAGGAAWSPDGSMIAYTAFHADRREAGFDLFVANADGTDHRRLTDGPAFDVTPFWSVDGRTIYYHVSPGSPGGFSLAAIPVDGGDPRWVLDNADDNPFFRRDPGTGELYFTRVQTANQYVTVDIGRILDHADRAGR